MYSRGCEVGENWIFPGRNLDVFGSEKLRWWCEINIVGSIKRNISKRFINRREILFDIVGEKIDFEVAPPGGSSSSSGSSSSGFYSVFSSDCSSTFVFRDIDSRSSLSNESVDDNTKRRWMG
jgi:hypothetical protein